MLSFSVADIQKWIGCPVDAAVGQKSIALIAVDSREVVPGALFIALPGAKTDGHLFLETAAQKGALYAIVKEEYSGSDFGMTLFRVPNTLLALQTAAQKWLQKSSAKVIAITGSIGKTTTKGFVYQLLKSTYRTGTSSGSKNSQIGMSLALLNETVGNEEFLVLEMGMTEPQQIQRLTEIAPPDIALITEIALVHAQGFSSLESIAEAKAEIFSHPKTALGFYSANSAFDAFKKTGGFPKKTYSRTVLEADIRLTVDANAFYLHEGDAVHELPWREFPADHVHTNLLAAIAVVRAAGMSIEEIGRALPTLQLPERRLQEVTKGEVDFICDCYNASLPSMKGALDAMQRRKTSGKKVAILGGIRELGKFSEECHREVGLAALDAVDEVICLGEECSPIVDIWVDAGREISWHLTFDELMEKVRARVRRGDLVLLKGSRSFQLERVLEKYSS